MYFLFLPFRPSHTPFLTFFQINVFFHLLLLHPYMYMYMYVHVSVCVCVCVCVCVTKQKSNQLGLYNVSCIMFSKMIIWYDVSCFPYSVYVKATILVTLRGADSDIPKRRSLIANFLFLCLLKSFCPLFCNHPQTLGAGIIL